METLFELFQNWVKSTDAVAFSKENDIDHDEYFEMLDAWLEEQRALQKV